MAVQDKYVDTKIVAGRLASSLTSQGAKTVTAVATFEVAAADDDLSVFRLFKAVPSTFVPISLRIACDALTNSTSWDMGLYKTGVGGAVVEVDILGAAINLAAGFSRILAVDGMVSVDLADAKKSLWELAGQTISSRGQVFDICLTANTIGSGAGTITVWGTFSNP